MQLVAGAILMCVLCVACGIFGGAPAPQRELTLLEKAKMQDLLFIERFKTQYRDAESLERLVKAGTASPGQRKIYNVKIALLQKVYPLLITFDNLVNAGTVPGQSKEDEINDLLNQLAASIQ